MKGINFGISSRHFQNKTSSSYKIDHSTIGVKKSLRQYTASNRIGEDRWVKKESEKTQMPNADRESGRKRKRERGKKEKEKE